MIVPVDGSPAKLPDFLIVGAPRAGTTSLFDSLARHPDVFMPQEKEPGFFYAWGEPPYYVDSNRKRTADYIAYRVEDYLNLFLRAAEGQVLGEASTWYLSGHERTIPNLKRVYGEKARAVKIVIVLRNPAERAWSHYWLKRGWGKEDLGFDEATRPEVIRARLDARLVVTFDYLGMGMYSRGVEAFLRDFNGVKIIIFEEMIRDAAACRAELIRFLELPHFGDRLEYPRLNRSGLPRRGPAGLAARLVFRPNVIKAIAKPFLPVRLRKSWKLRVGEKVLVPQKMDDATRRRLLAYYDEDIRRLETILGLDLKAWRQNRPERRGEEERTR
ncbi:MAG: sulfotransferase domain-containing protein [Candidatus Aminicenantes bacterium]|nr:sulfotransferase domain-containing protein [Candidatus Aminicenantes bacterium]